MESTCWRVSVWHTSTDTSCRVRAHFFRNLLFYLSFLVVSPFSGEYVILYSNIYVQYIATILYLQRPGKLLFSRAQYRAVWAPAQRNSLQTIRPLKRWPDFWLWAHFFRKPLRSNFFKNPNDDESVQYVLQHHKRKNILHDLIVVREIGGDTALYNIWNGCLTVRFRKGRLDRASASEAEWSVVWARLARDGWINLLKHFA
jgi:hypothetical protein